jgi:hypothetical protein
MRDGKIKNKRFYSLGRREIFGIALFLVAGIFFAGGFAQASVVTEGINLLSNIVASIIGALGTLLGLLMTLIIRVAQYNNFIKSDAITNGWVIVRNLCNMFFILILLFIAFATILRVEGYDIKRMLPKLIIMAVLINFSKTICGLIIDAAQLIMNVFVSAFSQVGGANLTQMMGLDSLLKFGENAKAADASKIFGAYIFALIYTLIASVVLIVLLVILVMRIVMIWIYVVLSPLAYFFAAFPQGKSYVSQWWNEFIKNVTVGPILAFFLWLSFVSLGNNQSGADILGMTGSFDPVNDPQGLTAAMSTNMMLKFVISIGMLMGGLIITQGAGGSMGKIAGAGMAKIQAGTGWMRKQTLGRAGTAAKVGAIAAGGAALAGVKGTAGAVNRLMGAGIASRMKPDNKLRATAAAGVGSLAMAGLRAPGRLANTVKERIVGNQTINRARHEQFMKVQAAATEKDPVKRQEMLKQAKISANDQKWAYNDTKKVFENDKGETLKDKFGREVKPMGAAEAAIHQSFGAAGSKSRAAADKVREEKVGEIEKGLKVLDAGQIQSIMENKGNGSVQRMAAAKVLAEGGNLRNKKDADLAKELTAGLRPVFDKVEDAIDKKQTHFNYDFAPKDKDGKIDEAKKAGEINRFKKRVDQDKVDLTRLPEEAVKNVDLMAAAKEHRGLEFWKDIESAHKKGGEKVRKAIEEALSKLGNNFSVSAATETDPGKKRSLLSDSITAKTTRAALSGNLEESFVNKETGAVDTEALQSFFRNSTPSEVSKVNAFAMNDFMAAHPAESHDILSKEGILSYGKLKSLYKKGENNDLVALLAKFMVSLNHPEAEKIEHDDDLSGLKSVV